MRQNHIVLSSLGMALMALCGSASAQFAPPSAGCPPGMYQQGFSCVYNSAAAPVQRQSPPAPPPAQWATRWGGIAIGSTASGGGFGYAVDMRSKRQAERASVQMCKDSGGGNTCKAFTYHNQCAVIAWGTQSFIFQNAETIEIATPLALEACSEKTQDCQIFYSACSKPVRVR